MKNKLLKVATMLVMAASMLLTSCEKWGEPTTTVPTPPADKMITQSFGIRLITDLRQMDTDTKSWNPLAANLDGLLVYSTAPATLTLTGTDNPRVYTKTNVTVAQLKTGISFTILPGTYTATYQTTHVRTTDPWSLNNIGPSDWYTYMPQIADMLDIKIQQAGLHLTGTPINLTATPEDALIIVDVPGTMNVKASTNIEFSGNNPYLLKNTANNYHWGYINQTPMWIRFLLSGVEKTVDASGYLKGNVYHLIAAFGAITDLQVTPMNINEVEVSN